MFPDSPLDSEPELDALGVSAPGSVNISSRGVIARITMIYLFLCFSNFKLLKVNKKLLLHPIYKILVHIGLLGMP